MEIVAGVFSAFTEDKRLIVRHPGAAAVLPFLDDPTKKDNPTILLVRQPRRILHYCRHAQKPDSQYLTIEIPAGVLDKEGESTNECALRELTEETGYHAARSKPLIEFLISPGYSTEKIFIYTAYNLTKVSEAEQRIELLPKKLTECLDLIKNKEINDAKTILAIFAWLQYSKTLD